jgi:hypothetical protein
MKDNDITDTLLERDSYWKTDEGEHKITAGSKHGHSMKTRLIMT